MANWTGTESGDLYTGTDFRDILRGEGGDDVIDGGAGNDDIYGGAGFDLLRGGAGLDKLYGGDDDDVIVYALASDLVSGEVIDGGAGVDTISVGGQTGDNFNFSVAKISGIEVLDAANETVQFTYSQIAGIFVKTAGTLQLSGTGSLALNGVVDVATIRLLSGNTSLSLENAFTNRGSFTVEGSSGNDIVTGNADTGDRLEGKAGADTLYGLGQNDILIGGLGRDMLFGGDGNDYFFVLSSAEMVGGEVYDGGDGFDTLQANSSINLAGVTLRSIETILIFNGDISGAAGQFNGLSSLEANAVNITGTGTATLPSYAAVGTYNILAKGVTLDLSGVNSINTPVVNGSTSADTVIGSRQTETIYGGRGNDVLDGGAGDDVLVGGEDRDTLTGGLGADTFVYTQRNDSGVNKSDTITDFAAGDTLDLSQVDADATVAGDQTFVFVAQGSGAAGELFWSYDAGTNVTTLQGDVDGGGILLNDVTAVDFQIFFTGDVTGLGAAVIL